MRIVAGILLLVAGIFNGCAGIGYVGVGGAGAALGAGLEKVGTEAAQANPTSKADLEKFAASTKDAQRAGGGLMIFGVFLFLMLALQIAGGVVLFMQKARGFVFVVGGLGLIAEIVGIALVKFGWTNIFGLVGSALAIYAAVQYGASARGRRPVAAAA